MKTKTTHKNEVKVITLGCSKNWVDSEVIMTQLKGNGYDVLNENSKKNSPIIIINTCGFIEEAKQESINTILQYAHAKDRQLIDKLYVSGCLSHRYKDELETEIPQVDAFFGTNELPRLLKTLKADYKQELVGERLLQTPSHYAYLKIAEGCDRPCSFCAIPLMRGHHQSRTIESLVTEVEFLAKRGVKELILIAQDLTYYGLDLYKKRNLAYLINKFSEVEGIEWIRLQYAYPAGFPTDVLDVIASNPKVCKYLDMPLQSGSDEILRKMKRGITREKTEQLLDTIRQKIPNIALRTTLILGFPTETEAHFEETYQFVEKMRFDRLGVFAYSHEENTTAHVLPNDVLEEEKQARVEIIMNLQQEISFELNQKKVKKTLNVLIDRKEGDYFIGRTEFDSPEVDNEVLISKKNSLKIGNFYPILIEKAEEFDLYGIPLF